MHLSPPSKTAFLLGWGGIIPFVGAALAKVYGGPLIDLYALVWAGVYAGVIITFAGAVHWGIALTGPKGRTQMILLIWSVIPALTVWPVMTLPPILRLPFLIGGLAIIWGADVIAYRYGHLPRWYMGLRHGVTIAAITSLLILGLA